ncbi:MAG: UDP-N-acetylmuramoyl-L-alanyl-D-glutamate--2,6-diaminopimelate ligase [Armatimonadetes bacterium]|nr:UDP-N-acetylmuramoyl-L-alanyl-D-glutamate--2,6-diaminopimelate ligase [Armatimonadota bacterium]
MRLKDLASNLDDSTLSGEGDVIVQGLTHDSRMVQPGDLFICLQGIHSDGHQFVADAIARGASAVLINRNSKVNLPEGTPFIATQDTRRALARVAAAFYARPSRRIRLIGVTGTNGKTTTTRLIASILRASGEKVGTIGTLGAELEGEVMDSEHTTPEADQLQSLLAEMVVRGADSVVMEVSSHALAQYRVDECEFDLSVFTNLTQDHLDYHGNLSQYFDCKRRLFTDLPAHSNKSFLTVSNADDPYGYALAKQIRNRVITYGMGKDAMVRAMDVHCSALESRFHCITLQGELDVLLPIGGAFQVMNGLAAVATTVGLRVPFETIQRGLAQAQPIPGRFEAVPTGSDFAVVVDYAHTPDGLKNLLESARLLHPQRLVLVFGCGGDRDRSKRPKMGAIAAELADAVILTADNPRSERAEDIIQEILQWIPSEQKVLVRLQPDRREAIALAIQEARCGDLILIAGKGHETTQIFGDRRIPFDDRLVVSEILGRSKRP